MWLGWGPELTFFYNDAYATMTLGAKHPWALGRPASEVWAEIWPDIGPRTETVMRTGKATWDEGLLLFLERNGYPRGDLPHLLLQPAAGRCTARSAACCASSPRTPSGSSANVGWRRCASSPSLLAAVRTEPRCCAAIERGLADQPARSAVRPRLAVRRRSDAGAAGLRHRHRARASARRAGDRPCRRAAGPSGCADPRRRAARDHRRSGTASGRSRPAPGTGRRIARSRCRSLSRGETRPAGMLLVGLNPYPAVVRKLYRLRRSGGRADRIRSRQRARL